MAGEKEKTIKNAGIIFNYSYSNLLTKSKASTLRKVLGLLETLRKNR